MPAVYSVHVHDNLVKLVTVSQVQVRKKRAKRKTNTLRNVVQITEHLTKKNCDVYLQISASSEYYYISLSTEMHVLNALMD